MGFFKIFISLIGLTLLSKILGFLREVFLSYYYGASYITDAYLIALTIPGVLFAFFTIAISVGFIPIFSRVSDNIEDRNNFVNKVFSGLLLVSTIIVILTIAFADLFVWILAPGFDEKTKELAIKFTRIFVLGVYLSCWLAVFSAFLNYFKKFTLVALAGIPFNISILASIVLSFYYNITWLVLGAVFGKLFEIIFLYPHVKKLNYNFRFLIDFKDENVRNLIFLSLPLMLSVAVNQINIIVDKSIASKLEVGAISAINYSHYLIELVIGVFVLTITTIFFPDLARYYHKKDYLNIEKTTEKSLRLVNFFVIPSFIFFMFYSYEIISLVYERGNFDSNAVKMTASAFIFFSVGLLGLAYREIFSRIFYAMHNTKIPVFNSIIGVIVNIILALILSRFMGVSGLALATSISAFITAILLFLSLSKLNVNIYLYPIFICIVKKIISSLLVISALYYWMEGVNVMALSFIFVILYIVILLFIKDETSYLAVDQLYRRVKK
ncbi:murein biosynthesis integral membrane protein MurJ [Acinetobacter haemolyticus]|uniref:murein biosynthesis integral membrane protein MurJ n=1 Tax=Acinetobacter haemolyticus TaxID=29430 RepID=UPI003EF481D9